VTNSTGFGNAGLAALAENDSVLKTKASNIARYMAFPLLS
jgi:hypothetical protein